MIFLNDTETAVANNSARDEEITHLPIILEITSFTRDGFALRDSVRGSTRKGTRTLVLIRLKATERISCSRIGGKVDDDSSGIGS